MPQTGGWKPLAPLKDKGRDPKLQIFHHLPPQIHTAAAVLTPRPQFIEYGNERGPSNHLHLPHVTKNGTETQRT